MLRFYIVKNKSEYELCLKIRAKVFIEEQNVPQEIEVDEYENKAIHFIVYLENTPIATARLLRKNIDLAKIERVAVLKEYRGKNIGKYIMNEIIKLAKIKNFKQLILSSQTQAIPFYEKLGFKCQGKEFLDAGIPHKMMILSLVNNNL